MKLRLIDIGTCSAWAAATITPGDNLMWNYGYIEHVLDVKPRGKTQLVITGTSLGRFGKQPSNTTFERVVTRARPVVKVLKHGDTWAIIQSPQGETLK